jgi:hypothetical protein
MPHLPDLDPDLVDKPSTLHSKLLDGRINSALEAQKARATSSLEDHKAKLADDKSETDADLAAEAAERTKELELRGLYHQKIMEITAGAIDRARDSAKFVQTAAAALMTAYAALLALVFSAKDRPLPLRGVYAAVYLGLAIALAVAYLAFIKQADPIETYQPRFSPAETQLARSAAFIDWVNSSVSNRRNALRASVVAFAFGIAFIPAPFVGGTGGSSTTATAAPTPPSIPREVPQAIAADATRLFSTQVETYLAAVKEGKANADAPASSPVKSCSGNLEVLNACAWTTDAAVERSFRRLAAFALVLVIAVPLGFTLYEKATK